MKFTIRHEIRGRIRVHMAQKRMSFHQADTLLYYLYHIFRVLETGSDEFMKKFTISRQCALLNSHARYAAALARLSEQAQETAGQAGWSSLSDRLIKLAEDGLQVQ